MSPRKARVDRPTRINLVNHTALATQPKEDLFFHPTQHIFRHSQGQVSSPTMNHSSSGRQQYILRKLTANVSPINLIINRIERYIYRSCHVGVCTGTDFPPRGGKYTEKFDVKDKSYKFNNNQNRNIPSRIDRKLNICLRVSGHWPRI